MKLKKVLGLAVVFVAAMFMVAGCAKSSASIIDQNLPAIQKQMDSEMSAASAEFKSVKVTREGDSTVVMTFTMSDKLSALLKDDASKKAFTDSINSSVDSQMQPVLQKLKDAGIKNPQVKFVINLSDGSEVYTHITK